MTLAYALTFFCDAMLYCAVLGCLGLMGGCREDIWRVPLLLAAACWLSGKLTGRPAGRPRPWLRWLPMALIPVGLAIAGGFGGALAMLPMAAYLPLYVYNNRRAPDYDYAADRFRHSLIGAGVALLLAALFRAASWKRGLPYLFLYFTLNVTLLRLLRHDDRVARSRRFRLLNLAGVALVCAAGFALSQPGVVAVLRQAWGWFADHVLLNAVALAFFAFQWVLYGLAWVLSKLIGPMNMAEMEMPMLNPEGQSQPMLAEAAAEVHELSPLVRLALQGIGIALLAVLAFMILRALSRRIARAEYSGGGDEREALDDGEAPRRPRGIRARREGGDGVRRQYRRALSLLRARGGRVGPTMNTLQIHRENADLSDPEAMAELRALYLPVRYGERPAGREETERARAAVERMRRAAGGRGR